MNSTNEYESGIVSDNYIWWGLKDGSVGKSEYLLTKHVDLNSSTQDPHLKLGMAVHVCDSGSDGRMLGLPG